MYRGNIYIMKSKYKVLIICNTYIMGGAEKVLADYLKDNKEFEFFLYTSSNPYIWNNFRGCIKEENIYTSNYVITPMNLKKYPYRVIKMLYKLLINLYNINKIVKNNNISILYGNNSSDIPLLIMYKMLNPRLPNISHIHDMLEKKDISGLVLSKFYKYINCIIVPSKATKNKINKLTKNKIKINVVYNNVINNSNDFKYVNKRFKILEEYKKNRRIIIAFIGTISERKYPELFVEIIEKLSKERQDIQAIMVGKILDKKIYDGISIRVKEYNLPITYLGELKRDEMAYIYRYIDILILTSKKDPLPTVILEAMNNNILVFSRNVDGVSEMIEDKMNGFLFSPHASINQIVKKLQNILDLSNNQVKGIKQNAKDTINLKFSYNNKINQVNNLIYNMMHKI